MIDYIISENAKVKLNKKCNLVLYPFPLRNPKAKKSILLGGFVFS